MKPISILVPLVLLVTNGCSSQTTPEHSPPSQTHVPQTNTISTVPDAMERHGTKEGTILGIISDSMCKGDHSGMLSTGKYGKTNASCVSKCLQEGQKPVLVEKPGNAVFNFTDAADVHSYMGQNVSISGHIDYDSKTIHVHDVKVQ